MTSPSARAALQKPLRVLIVDDNLDQVHAMAYLIRDMGHHPDYAINGIVALDIARRARPHVALLDIGLPDTSGFHLVREFRKDPELRAIYLLGITGLPVDRAEALTRGFDDLLQKPLDPNLLEMLLKRASGHIR